MVSTSAASIVVAGVVRNGERWLEENVHRIKNALSSFAEVQWIIIESDSEDGTVKCLEKLSKEVANFKFESLGQLSKAMPLRTQRLAHSRNTYLHRIRGDRLYQDVDYVLVADLDEVNKLIDEKAILSCWARNDWDVCTANQRGPYYDIWALRHPDWCAGDCWSQHAFLVKHGVDPEQSRFISVSSRMIRIPEDAEWIEVDSAFGGLAIYRRDALAEGVYIGLTPTGEEVVDHISLHEAARSRGARIFINPKMINAALTSHTEHLASSNPLPRRRFKSLAQTWLGKSGAAFVRAALRAIRKVGR